MSFCPTKDIHSVYLDNELPEIHKAEYEKHLSECPKCRADLAEVQAVREVFKSDAEKITPDEEFLNESYERLMIKMSYNKNIVKANKKSPLIRLSYIVSAAAAAVMLAIFIPVGLSSRKNTAAPEMASLSNVMPMSNFGNNISFGSGNNMVVSGNMNDVLSSYSLMENNNYSFNDWSVENINRFIAELSGMDLLRPDFAEDNIISIRISIPKVENIPIDCGDNSFGVVVSGNYQWNQLIK